MPREATFNFVPAHQINKVFANNEPYHVTVYTKPGKMLVFPAKHPETAAIIGKYLYWVVDETKNVIGWKVFTEGELHDLKNASKVTEYSYGKTRKVTASLTLPMKGIKYESGKTYKKLEVKKYKQQGMLNDGKSIMYIKI